MSKKIVFRVGKDGNVSITKLEGYGEACLDATKMLERALGSADESTRKMTDEYNDDCTHEMIGQIEH
jgi:hypothetical protein